ncbi:phage holin family protein [Alteribacillus bidgolensis]|uniref:Putative membrane protein n=1 Tax=Alteribacillus bidgolensis TaxID=930129 RepID=A0A1G8E8B0_9BACI|nr:phage holin family protein [Alteribacillus bidgolensis]SDH65950.1 putative membrane protein [Alteribacillus bidgolensis]
MGCIVPFIVNAVMLMVVAGFFQGFELQGVGAAVMASIILTIINMLVRPLLVVLTLPITVFTLGLFIFIINAALLMLTSELMGDSFYISGFGMALLAAIIIAILNIFINNFIVDPLRRK